MSTPLTSEQLGALRAKATRYRDYAAIGITIAAAEALLDEVEQSRPQIDRLTASVQAAHRRIDEATEFLATRDTAGWSDDAIGLGLDMVAHLDGPGPRASDDEPQPPALPWAAFLSDVDVSNLVDELGALVLDHYRPGAPNARELLALVDQLLVRTRAAARAEVE